MSTFSDYKLYKRYEPAYADWKNKRNILDAKRLEYLKQHPEALNKEDIQRGKTLLRAIDVMDEYSQKRAQDMEVATQTAVASIFEVFMMAGMVIGLLLSRNNSIQKFLNKFNKSGKNEILVHTIFSTAIGGALGCIAALPMFSKSAKAEVAASRKGRFEAMRKDLVSPNGFAVLTDEQIKQAEDISKNIQINDKKENRFFEQIKIAKEMAIGSKEYKQQRKDFEKFLEENKKHLNDKITPEEEEKAKKDQQLLTKLVEKIDIASQDYAENAELATGILTTTILTGGFLTDYVASSIMKLLKVKSVGKISAFSKIFTAAASMTALILGAKISKEASRVGRYKIKQELLNKPENFVYVDDKKAEEIDDIEIPSVKNGILKFMKNAYKNNKEYQKYKKTTAKEEKRFYKAVEQLELTQEQIKDAKRLQKNTFMTFNKVDENSQKFSESIEALGLTINQPLNLICSLFGLAFGLPILTKNTKGGLEAAANTAKYMSVILLSTVPSMVLNAFVTQKQKRASRVADMMTINELNDYRYFK